jgi:hypothetical protein
MKSPNPEILFRLSKYGKWEPLNAPIEFEDQSKLFQYCIGRFESSFIQLRVNGVESTIKTK